MRNRRILSVLAVAITAVVAASFLIPAAVGASPNAKASSVVCTATGTKPLGNTGVVSASFKGKGSGSAGTPAASCAGKLTGKWAKNSTQFSVKGSAQTPVVKGGGWKLAFKTNPLTAGKLVGTLTNSGLSTGASITVDWGCDISYPPLKIKCWIIVSSAA